MGATLKGFCRSGGVWMLNSLHRAAMQPLMVVRDGALVGLLTNEHLE